jgi:hypothetical protein
MSRPAKPYLERDWYVTRAGGVYHKLCHKSERLTQAKKVLREYLVTLDQEGNEKAARAAPRLTVALLFAKFLDAVKTENSGYCYADYQRWLTEFSKRHGAKKARDITKADANEFKRRLMNATWQRGKQPPRPDALKAINHALIALRRAFNWPSRRICCQARIRSPASSCCPGPSAPGWSLKTSTRRC